MQFRTAIGLLSSDYSNQLQIKGTILHLTWRVRLIILVGACVAVAPGSQGTGRCTVATDGDTGHVDRAGAGRVGVATAPLAHTVTTDQKW